MQYARSLVSALSVVLALPACRGNREQTPKSSIPAASHTALSPATVMPSAALETPPAPTVAVPTLTCAELDPERPEPDRRGKRSARWHDTPPTQLPPGWIAYHAGGQVYLVTTDGKRRVVVGPGASPRWLPNGRELVFVSAHAGQPPRLFITNLDCTLVRAISGPLTTRLDSDSALTFNDLAVRYAVSPDGTHVAYSSELASGGRELFVSDIATGSERKLTTQADYAEPAWSPDARAVVIDAAAGEGTTIVSVDIATNKARELGIANNPAFSFLRDGRLLFQTARGDSLTIEDREALLVLLDPAAEGAMAVPGSRLTPGLYTGFQPAPDGRTIAASWSLWTGNGAAGPAEEGLALFVVPEPQAADRGKPLFGESPHATEITFVRPRTRHLALGAGDALDVADPSWAPDSRHLTFTLCACDVRLDTCAQQVVAVDTRARTTQVVFLARGNAPRWQPAPSPTPP